MPKMGLADHFAVGYMPATYPSPPKPSRIAHSVGATVNGVRSAQLAPGHKISGAREQILLPALQLPLLASRSFIKYSPCNRVTRLLRHRLADRGSRRSLAV